MNECIDTTNDYSSSHCSSHNENLMVAFDCSYPVARSPVYCLLGDIEVSSEYIANVEAIHRMQSNLRRTVIYCQKCGLFKFGNWLTMKEKRAKKWALNQSSWLHTDLNLCQQKHWILYKLAHLRWTKFFEMVATITDAGVLKFSLYLKDNVVIVGNSVYAVNDSADINAVMSMFFPNLVPPNRFPSAEPEVREKEDIDGFFDCLQNDTVKTWEICTKTIVTMLRPYQEDAIRFMISREDPGQQLTFNVKDDYIILPTKPPVLYSPVTGIFSRQLDKPSLGICPPGVIDAKTFPPRPSKTYVLGGILADEMGLGKTVEVIGLILSHQRGKGVPRIIKEQARQQDAVKMIVNEIVSAVVAALDGYSGLEGKVHQRYEQMFCYDNLESTNPKRRRRNKRGGDRSEPLTISCTKCNTICSQERVHWDRFNSCDIPFICPECILNENKVYPIKGTLIIAPSTICHQWYEELRRHIRDDVKIDMYRGLIQDGYKHPEYLSTQDIVICSFETLRSEVYFVEARPRLDSLRHHKRHRIAPTPLLAVEWWRICIDEAQMVEGASSSVAAMCEDLRAVNRWCITGTPITNSLQDLYGLVRFLDVEPFWNDRWWRKTLMMPYRNGNKKPLVDLFSRIMWRNTKKTVGDQMLMPTKGSDLTVLRFTPIEELYYRENLANCRLRVHYMPHLHTNLDTPISSLHGKDFEKLMEPLQILRKFIVFPGIRFQETKQKVSTEDNLQEELFRISTQQAEVCQRNILMYYSGLGGLEWLCGRKESAAKYYAKAVCSMKELDEMNRKLDLKGSRGAYRQLKSDKLQQIHIFSAIVDLQKEGVEVEGVNENEAQTQLDLVFKSYTEQTVTNLTQSYAALSDASPKYRNIFSKVKNSIGWLCEVARLATTAGLQPIFVDAVRTALEKNGLPSVPASNLSGLNFYVVKRWDELVECARKVLAETEKIAKNNILEKQWIFVLERIIACHFSPKNRELLKSCPLCVCNRHISQLESLLFIRAAKTGNNHEEIADEGTAGEQKSSALEVILRTILVTLTRMQKEVKYDLIESGKKTVTHLEEFKALLNLAKRLFASANEYAAKIDEVRQCKLRLQYATEEEIKEFGSHLPVSLIRRGMETAKRHVGMNELEMEKLNQTRYLAKLRYLSNLRTQQTHECPICMTVVDNAWIVYPCAHCLCVLCFNRLTTRRARSLGHDPRLVRCVVCRAVCHLSYVSYVQKKTAETGAHLLDIPSVQLKRSISVKVDAIIRRIKSIRLRDPTSKTLLFTSLSMLINPLCRVMSENNINFCNFLGADRQKILADFRLKPEIEVLIMPMSSGARGLNLTAANNIIFAEPQMDVSQIAQAIGRIDRIGQKKEMMIHHFVVFGSIEEQIHYKYSQDQDKDWTVQSIVHLLGMGDTEALIYDD